MDFVTQVVAEVFKTLLAAGMWPVAVGLLVAAAVLLVVWWKYGVGGLILAALRSWHEMKTAETTLTPDGSHEEGTGAPPMPVQPDGTIHLDQKPPTDWS